ncbi:MAG: hypothetical protein QXN71_01300 [Candidatus Aenigmatarchaeota archaeon]
MEKYKSGVEFEHPNYLAGRLSFSDLSIYFSEDDEEMSDIEEILSTCTFKKADEQENDEKEPCYVDTIQEEDLYVWKTLYPSTDEDYSIEEIPIENTPCETFAD